MKGGYKIIDLKNTNFTLSTGVTIEGVHEKVENNYYKALLVENFQIEGVEQVAQFVTFTASRDNLVGNLTNGTQTITITSADLVTIANVAGPTALNETAKTKTTTK